MPVAPTPLTRTARAEGARTKVTSTERCRSRPDSPGYTDELSAGNLAWRLRLLLRNTPNSPRFRPQVALRGPWGPSQTRWPAEWQRHYAALREVVADAEGQAGAAEVLPGFTVHGMNIGKWLTRQRTSKAWAALPEGQRERLQQLGITPPAPAPKLEASAKPSDTAWAVGGRTATGVRAGQMTGLPAARLEKLGMVWSLADERFQENLKAARAHYDLHWTLCAPRSAVALDRPVGQWLSNLRHPGALDGHPEWKTAGAGGRG
ncbi:helicase associated domain-containing protein [[Kitasatospora] papulosa]|uniref:helicase associated domain-containing protein n=1 Tax=[Kitasatospora] papulosa TaxID=1464011 RepID=UPI0036CBA1E0